MFVQSEFQRIKEEYDELVKQRGQKIRKIWISILFVVIIALVGVALIPNIFKSETGIILYSVYGGMILVTILVGVTISLFYISEKPTFEYLFEEVYKKINMEKRTLYTYKSYEKEKWDFNKKGGLFTKFARIGVKRHVTSTTSLGNKFDIFDCTMETGAGNNRRVHFDGIYIIVRIFNSTQIQVRSHSKPSLKGVEYIKSDEFLPLKVYIEENRSITNVELKYIKFVENTKKVINAKKVYLSVLNDEVHFAYVPNIKIRKQKNLSLDKINDLYNNLLKEITLIDELVEVKEFGSL